MARGTRKKKDTASKAVETKTVETPVAEKVETEAAPVAEETKAEVASAAEKKTETKKTASSRKNTKTAAAKSTAKTTAKATEKNTSKTTEKAADKTTEKTPAKKAVEERKVFIEYNGNQVLGADLVERAKADKGVSSAKKIELYVQPETNKVYYVIDGTPGDFDLF